MYRSDSVLDWVWCQLATSSYTPAGRYEFNGTLDNGSVYFSYEDTEAVVAHYSCSNGYNLIGNSERRCLEDGYWNGTMPHCQS